MSFSSDLSRPFRGVGRASAISDDSLWRFNLIACILHTVQGGAMLVASQEVASIKAFSKNITTSFLVYDPTTQALVPATKVRPPHRDCHAQ